MEYFVTTQPLRLPLELADLKAHVEILDYDGEDSKLTQYLQTCVSAIEKAYSLALITQTRTMHFDLWGRHFALYGWPIQAILSVSYTANDGTVATLPAENYSLLRNAGRLRFKAASDFPAVELAEAEAITVTYRCGFGDNPSDVPAEIRQSLLLLVGHFYAHREQVILGQVALEPKTLEWGADRLLAPYAIPR